jgi:glycosyltransferase involved in cell wall biosynthesis
MMQSIQKCKIIYIADRIIPNGNAGGVRVNYISRLFDYLGYKTTVISFNNDKKFVGLKNIEYLEIPMKFGYLFFFYKYFLAGFFAIFLAHKSITINKKFDISLIIYSTNIFFVLPIFCYAKLFNIKIYFDVVENFHSGRYKLGIFSPKFLLFKLLFKYIYSSGDGILGISQEIVKFFKRRGVKTILLPPLFEFDKEHLKEKKLNLGVNLIYSGSPFGKEDLNLMIRALAGLSLDSRKHLVFNLSGVSKQVFIDFCDKNDIDFADISPMINFYDWLSVEDLYKLYDKSHFLFFLRKDNLANRSNFPMKLIEMLSFGIPPILSNVGDYGNIIKHQINGFIIPENDLRNAIKYLEIISKMKNQEYTLMQMKAFELGNKYDYRTYGKFNKQEILSFLN